MNSSVFQPKRSLRLEDDLYVWNADMRPLARSLHRGRVMASKALGFSVLIASTVLFIWFILEAFFFADRDFIFLIFQQPTLAGFLFFSFLLVAAFTFFLFVRTLGLKTYLPQTNEKQAVPGVYNGGTFQTIEDFFSEEAIKTIEEAFDFAEKYGHVAIEPLHLFVGGMSQSEVALLFARLGVGFNAIKDPLIRRLRAQVKGSAPNLSEGAEDALLSAFKNASVLHRDQVDAIEIFYEAFLRDEFLQELLFQAGVDENKLNNTIEWLRWTARMRERYEKFRQKAVLKPVGPMNRSMTSVATPILDDFSDDLTELSVRGALPFLVGRKKELEAVFRTIEGSAQGALLIGPEGVGKSAILAGVAEKMVEEDVPRALQDNRLVQLSTAQIAAGADEVETQKRLSLILADAQRSRNMVLAIPHLHELIMADGLLVDFLEKTGLPVFATTTPEHRKEIMSSAFARVFAQIEIAEPEPDEAIRIVESHVSFLEFKHNVFFLYEAIEKAVQLTDRYLHESYLPDKAIRLVEQAALQVAKTKGENGVVKAEDVARLVSDSTHIPVTRLAEEEKEKLLHLEERMRSRLVGQTEAVVAVANALRRGRSGLQSDKRPISAFLFLGPTGVGKTELAKTVAEVYFGSEEAMHRFDMSEYGDASSIDRLLNVLTEAVRQAPFALILLDEFEKAHPDILNLFLQIFEDGRLTNTTGRTVDFTNTIIIATSNAAADLIQKAVKEGMLAEELKNWLIEEHLKTEFRPEMLNRFDGVIVFKPLTISEVEQIAVILLKQVEERLEAKGIHFKATGEAVTSLAKKGFDPKFGARPLRRVIQDDVDNAIAELLLAGKVQRRDTIVLEPTEIRVEPAKEL